MRHFVGMDLHSSNTYIGILREDDRRVLKGKFPNELSTILEVLFPFKEDIEGVVVESTFNWYWLVDGLMDEGYRVHLSNPCASQQYRGLKYTDDRHDAFWLATMLKLGILPEGTIFKKEERQLRDLLRKRLMLVHHRTSHILSLKSLFNRNLSLRMSSNTIKTLDMSDIDELIKDHHLNLSAKANIAAMLFLNAQIKLLEKEIMGQVRIRPEFEKLMTIPGIGKSLALTIIMETGNINRFKSASNYASYCRCVPSKRLSNDKVKGKNNRKNGNKYLGWAFVEAANFAKRYCPLAKFYYQKKTSKTNSIIAIKAMANKIAKVCFYIIKDGVDYDPLKIFAYPSMNKGCDSKPARGLANNHNAPIGLPVATP